MSFCGRRRVRVFERVVSRRTLLFGSWTSDDQVGATARSETGRYRAERDRFWRAVERRPVRPRAPDRSRSLTGIPVDGFERRLSVDRRCSFSTLVRVGFGNSKRRGREFYGSVGRFGSTHSHTRLVAVPGRFDGLVRSARWPQYRSCFSAQIDCVDPPLRLP